MDSDGKKWFLMTKDGVVGDEKSGESG